VQFLDETEGCNRSCTEGFTPLYCTQWQCRVSGQGRYRIWNGQYTNSALQRTPPISEHGSHPRQEQDRLRAHIAISGSLHRIHGPCQAWTEILGQDALEMESSCRGVSKSKVGRLGSHNATSATPRIPGPIAPAKTQVQAVRRANAA
jgi:hypothetical protein